MVESVWNIKVRDTNSATRITAKFKLLKRVLKRWSKDISHLNKVIEECDTVLAVLDKLEEQRTLFRQDSNFRKVLKNHILKLLKYKKEYWRKRYTIRRTKFGDEITKFFHAAATKRYRQNTITRVTDHNEKAAALWETYKQRMGSTTNPRLHSNLEKLVQRNGNLEQLPASVAEEEY